MTFILSDANLMIKAEKMGMTYLSNDAGINPGSCYPRQASQP